jgi:homoserine kinase
MEEGSHLKSANRSLHYATSMARRTVTAFAPATISNLGSGFDVLGLAIDRPGDVAVAERRPEQGLLFRLQGRTDSLPTDAHNNVAAHVVSLLLDETRPPFGIALTLRKKMPIGSGLETSCCQNLAGYTSDEIEGCHSK